MEKEFTVADYEKMGDYLLELVRNTGGIKEHLYTKNKYGGLAWSYISTILRYLENDQGINAYNEVVRKVGLSEHDLVQIASHPFRKCTDVFFFIFQNYVLSYFRNYDFEYVRKIIQTYTVRNSAFQLTPTRKGSLGMKIIPYGLMCRLSPLFASRYTTLSDCFVTARSPLWKRHQQFDISFTYSKTPVRPHPELGRPEKLVWNGSVYEPDRKTCYGTGLSDYYSIMSHSTTTYGFAVLKGLILNSGYRNHELPLLPDQVPEFYDGSVYRMTADGFFTKIYDSSGEVMTDSFGKKVHYTERARFAFDGNHRIVYGLDPDSEKTDPRVVQVVTYNSERTIFKLDYDRLSPSGKFCVSVASDLRKTIQDEHGIDILNIPYIRMKRFLKKQYRHELRGAWLSRRVSQYAGTACAAAAAIAVGTEAAAGVPAVIAAAAGTGAFILGLTHDYHAEYVRRIQNLRMEDAEDRLERETSLTEKLVAARDDSYRLLLNILPESIAFRLNQKKEKIIADYYDSISVLFSDLENFTETASHIDAKEIVHILNSLFSQFDTLAIEFGIEKIKTIGDAYMAVSGLSGGKTNNAEQLIHFGIAMYKALDEFNKISPVRFDMRIGISSGPVTAGVIGKTKFAYDMWGDTVNMASRMESTGKKYCIHVSASVYEQTKTLCNYESFPIDVKGKGFMQTYLLKVM